MPQLFVRERKLSYTDDIIFGHLDFIRKLRVQLNSDFQQALATVYTCVFLFCNSVSSLQLSSMPSSPYRKPNFIYTHTYIHGSHISFFRKWALSLLQHFQESLGLLEYLWHHFSKYWSYCPLSGHHKKEIIYQIDSYVLKPILYLINYKYTMKGNNQWILSVCGYIVWK